MSTWCRAGRSSNDVPAGSGDPREPKTKRTGDRLFRNLGNGQFQDVTTKAASTEFPRGYGQGVAIGDYDNDGRPDVFVARWHAYALSHNRGDGTFDDVTESARLGGDRGWPTSAVFADLDHDGDLDLYVCHYAAWDPVLSPPCPHPRLRAYVSCGPHCSTRCPTMFIATMEASSSM